MAPTAPFSLKSCTVAEISCVFIIIIIIISSSSTTTTTAAAATTTTTTATTIIYSISITMYYYVLLPLVFMNIIIAPWRRSPALPPTSLLSWYATSCYVVL